MGDDAPCPAWVVYPVMKSNFQDVCSRVTQFTDLLTNNNIAHNLALIRDGKSGRTRMYIWARQHTTSEQRSYSDFNMAVTELAGHCYYGDMVDLFKNTQNFWIWNF